MHAPLPQPSSLTGYARRSGAAMPVIIVVVALALSVFVFFTFTRRTLEKPAPDVASQEVVKEAPQTQAPTPKPEAKPPQPAAEPPKPAFGFARPMDLGKEMVRSLSAGDYARAGALAAAADPSQAKTAADTFEKMVKDLKVKAGSESQVELLGLVENKTRVAIPLTLPGIPEPVRLQLDLERDDAMGWKVSQLHLPKELSPALATASTVTPAPSPTASAGMPEPAPSPKKSAANTAPAAKSKPKTPALPLFTVEEMPDALTFGSDFVRALLKHDFAAARKFVDEKRVPSERLAGLCIVFEEGEYEFKPTRPLIITIANPEVSWVIAQVQSQKLQQSTEFGLELQRGSIQEPWKVVGLNLSEILSSFASSASKMGVPYTPIVNNPKGGESLALYFEYDQAELHPRALKQLEIVAGLLKSDPSKKLQIAGHTDDKGTDRYNLSLSQSRAESVKKQLADMGVPAAQIITLGMGKAQPLGPNQKADGTDNPEGRSKNRRAEIYLDF